MNESPDSPAGPDISHLPPGPGEPPAPRRRITTPVLVGAMAGALLLLAFGVAILRQGGRARGSTGSLNPGAGLVVTRPSPQGAPIPVSPMGSVPHASVSFHWQPGADLKEYRAVLYDNLAQEIWRSDPTTEDSVQLPSGVFAGLSSGPTYFWKVIGYREDGTEVPSNGAQFRLAP